jgi:hypothetical protein
MFIYYIVDKILLNTENNEIKKKEHEINEKEREIEVTLEDASDEIKTESKEEAKKLGDSEKE